MFQFFRKIRRSFINSNSVKKYSLYAIGEILLVVMGILIALQVNEWNQKRLDRIEEKTILLNLKEDFNKATDELKFLNSLRNDIISAAKAITSIDVSRLDQYHTSYIDSLFSKTLYGPTFNNKSGSLEVLLTSGKINLIKNQDLRKILIEWPGDVEDMIEDEYNQDQLYRGPYQEFLSNHISWNDLMKPYLTNQIRFNAISLEAMPDNPIIKSDYRSALSSMYFLNLLHNRASLCMVSNQETKVLIEKANGIIMMIEEELKD